MAGQREGWGAGLRTPTRPATSLGFSGFSLFHSSILPQLKDDNLIEKKQELVEIEKEEGSLKRRQFVVDSQPRGC
jgi:hypothetical protein